MPVTVLLKEYLPGTHGVAMNEVRMVSQLAPLPPYDRKWRAASDLSDNQPPVVPLLGYFVSATSPAGQEMCGSGASTCEREEDSAAVWLVYKWEALQPLAGYPAATQTKPPSAFRLFRWGAGGDTPQGLSASQGERYQMLRAIVQKSLQALAYCHERGIAHGALGPSSLLMTTHEDSRWQQLVIRLDNFGFARQSESGGATWQGGIRGHGTDDGFQGDLQALGLTLLETVISALSEGSRDKVQHEALQRLVCTVFRRETAPFRKYCLQDPDWSAAVHFLDEREQAGWSLLGKLLAGRTSAADLCADTFCQSR